ncbi:MAG TPA: SRPBCC domain-containing protein [Gaiella sp.]|jgi:uncharacterized protein YndB with AHSA1/START domain|nr:SRPBCC domain-containing protein [Gaiella sp.]
MSGLELHLDRLVTASPDRVFDACVRSEALAAWWGPSGFTSTVEELDARVGGGYRIAMQPPEGDAFHLRGEFRVVEPPHRLVYTFAWEDPDPDDRETLARLTFRAVPEGTLISLDHGSFATDARYELHRAGWSETLERLASFLA